MARTFVRASSQRAEVTTAVVSAYPLSMSCHVKPTTSNNTMTAMCVARTSTQRGWHALGILSTAKPFVETNANNVGGVSQHGTSVTNGTWCQIGAVCASATSRIAYFNGSAATANTTSSTPTLTRTVIGALWDQQIAAATSFFDGAIAQCGWWNVALTADEMLALANGADPRLIRPSALVAYVPVAGIASPEQDYLSATGFTITGSPAQSADDPMMTLPPTGMIFFPATATDHIVDVALLTETDSLLALVPSKTRDTTLLEETDLLQPVVVEKSIIVPTLTETDQLFGLSGAKTADLALLVENATLLAPTPTKTRDVGLFTSTEELLPITAVKSRDLSILAETDSALATTGAKTFDLPVLEETDLLIGITEDAPGPQVVDVALLTETDSLLAVTPVKTRDVGLLAETDITFAITGAKTRDVALLTETDANLAVAGVKTRDVGLLTETGITFALTGVKSRDLALLTEADSNLALTGAKVRDLGLLTETDTFLAPSRVKTRDVGLLSESAITFNLTGVKVHDVAILTEVDTVFGLGGFVQFIVYQTVTSNPSSALVRSRGEDQSVQAGRPQKPASSNPDLVIP